MKLPGRPPVVFYLCLRLSAAGVVISAVLRIVRQLLSTTGDGPGADALAGSILASVILLTLIAAASPTFVNSRDPYPWNRWALWLLAAVPVVFEALAYATALVAADLPDALASLNAGLSATFHAVSTGALAPLPAGERLGMLGHLTAEHSAQVLSVGLFAASLGRVTIHSRLGLAAMSLSALVFVGHGLFALAFPHAMPSGWPDLFERSIGGTDLRWLTLAGALDLLVAGMIWIPRLRLPAAAWMVLWGGATALARLVAAYRGPDPTAGELLEGWAAFLIRWPHALLPLAAIYFWQRIAPQ